MEAAKKLEKLHADDLEKVKTFIKDIQKVIQDNILKPKKYIDSRGSWMLSLLPLYDCKSKSVQINEQAFWNTANSYTSDKESIPKKATDEDLITWYSKFLDFSKIDIKNTTYQMTSASLIGYTAFTCTFIVFNWWSLLGIGFKQMITLLNLFSSRSLKESPSTDKAQYVLTLKRLNWRN